LHLNGNFIRKVVSFIISKGQVCCENESLLMVKVFFIVPPSSINLSFVDLGQEKSKYGLHALPKNILVDNVDIYEENTGGDNEYDVDYDDINSDKFGDSCYYVGKGGVDDVEIGDVIEDNKGDDSVGDE
ncbi:Nck-Associated Protein 1-Like, partial [Manis pentadactyla]